MRHGISDTSSISANMTTRAQRTHGWSTALNSVHLDDAAAIDGGELSAAGADSNDAAALLSSMLVVEDAVFVQRICSWLI